MAGALDPLGELGREVARVLDESTSRRGRAVDEARRRFSLSEVETRRAAPWLSWRVAFVGGLATALLASGVWLMRPHHHALTFDVDGAPGLASNWLSAPPTVPLRLQFSEGTNVRLEPDSRLRVVELAENGASLSLERGHLHAEVTHRVDTAWKVAAGPFTVAVTGTVFDVSWEPSTEQLLVNVAQGSVIVRGASLERTVRASESLQATTPGHHFELSGELPGGEPEASAPSLTSAEPPAPEAVNVVKDEHTESPWHALARRGALREAFASADAGGFSSACALANPAELLQLGDGARLSGKPDRASEALLTLRRRFPGDTRRAAAAFALGKVGFDQRRAYEQAAEWFATALREQPSGPLAREAAGRLIEALRAADDSAGARRAARDYLARYPEGPHADLARSVLH